MKNFLEWLRERKEVNLYHGTTAGKDDATLNSFIAQGIKTDRAQGYGQGQGFYGYDDYIRAKDHSVWAKKHGGQYLPKEGEPMVVAHKATLNPRDYELDKEIQFDDFYRFFVSNEAFIDRFFVNGKSIVVEFDDNPRSTILGNKNIYGFFSHKHGLGFWLKDPDTFDGSKVEPDDGITNLIIGKSTRPPIEAGAEINEVFKAFVREIPGFAERYKSFVRAIMKRASEGRTKGSRAWKYVGQNSIQPDWLQVQGRDQINIKKI